MLTRMVKKSTQPIEIFRAGRHTSMSGSCLQFSESDLAASAKAYDPAVSEAPIVVGHPSTDAPAYGWINQLSIAGDTLVATPAQVDPAFSELVSAGRFKKISSAFYLPDSPINPVPGVYYLRHVGFLGAQPPAVKGLKDAHFADGQNSDFITVEFSEWSDLSVASLFRNLREWMIANHSLDDADKALPGFMIDALVQEAQKEAMEDAAESDNQSPAVAGYSETQPQEVDMSDSTAIADREKKLAADQAKLDAERAAFAEQQEALKKSAADQAAFSEQQKTVAAQAAALEAREAKLREAEEASRVRELGEFAESLVKAGTLLPRYKADAVLFMAALDTQHTVEFGEGADKATKTQLDWFKGFLSALPKQIHFGEFSAPDTADLNTASFAAPRDFSVDKDALDLHNKAIAYQRAHTDISYLDAVKAVRS